REGNFVHIAPLHPHTPSYTFLPVSSLSRYESDTDGTSHLTLCRAPLHFSLPLALSLHSLYIVLHLISDLFLTAAPFSLLSPYANLYYCVPSHCHTENPSTVGLNRAFLTIASHRSQACHDQVATPPLVKPLSRSP
ncbi:hypothetical protein U1Q18_013229, partial [Sarracenia purpurea var. burkii]